MDKLDKVGETKFASCFLRRPGGFQQNVVSDKWGERRRVGACVSPHDGRGALQEAAERRLSVRLCCRRCLTEGQQVAHYFRADTAEDAPQQPTNKKAAFVLLFIDFNVSGEMGEENNVTGEGKKTKYLLDFTIT